MTIGIGASAGGLAASKALLATLPRKAGFAIILVVHLDPDHESVMVELLAKSSALSVTQAADGMVIQPNHVYVVPPGATLRVKEQTIRLEAFEGNDRVKPIDRFLRSLAEEAGKRAVGVVLSGTGSDGASGLGALKEAGGLTLVQDPQEAEYDGMPRSAQRQSAVDRTLLLQDMPEVLLEYMRRADEVEGELGGPDKEVGASVRQICSLLRRAVGHDFSGYKTSTLVRRIHRRVIMREVDTFADYAALLDKDEKEAHRLLRELLISVTRFFRDPDAFDALTPMIQKLVARRGSEPIRVWVAGCATGEEAYSLAILIAEEFERVGKPVSAQIFATEIDLESLEKARQGRYAENIEQDVSPERLRRFFRPRGEEYEINKDLRGLCFFSAHNLVRDPPFSRMDLISCRNVMIYFGADLQARTTSLFQYALKPSGTLLVGTAESLSGESKKLFRPVNKSQRIYEAQKPGRHSKHFPFSSAASIRLEHMGGSQPKRRGLDVGSIFSRSVLPHLGITVVAVDDDDRILDSYGHPERFLAVRPGPPADDLFSLLHVDLVGPLRSALYQARKSGGVCTLSDVGHAALGGEMRLQIAVYPSPHDKDEFGFWMLIFQESTAGRGEIPAEVGAREALDSVNSQLESELEASRQRLRATSEELEAHIEELRLSNEEMLSMNEELQTSNEELETSREEIQSTNQELQVLNAELTASVEDRDQAHSDLLNLFSGNPCPTIFLDRDLRIRQFTPAVVEVFRLLPSDTGRPITDITSRLSELDWGQRCREVLSSFVTYETVVASNEQEPSAHVYLLRISPYRTLDNSIGGLVLSFFDITEVEQAKHQAEKRSRQLASIATLAALIPAPNGERRIDFCQEATREICRVLGVKAAAIHRLLPGGQELELVSSHGWEGAARRPHDPQDAVGRALRNGHSLQWQAGEDGGGFDPAHPLALQGLGGGLLVSLSDEGSRYGVLSVYEETSRRFSADEVNFLEAVSFLVTSDLVATQESFLVALQTTLANTLASASELSRAVPEMLYQLGQRLGACGCELWLVSPTSGEFSRAYAIGTTSESCAGGEALIAKAWHDHRTVWETELPLLGVTSAGDASAPSGRAKEPARVPSGFACSLSSGKDTYGVLACFFGRRLYASSRLLAGLTTAGLALGECVRRARGEAAVKENEERLYRALQCVPFPLCIISTEGRILLVSEATYKLTGFSSEELTTVQDWVLHVLRYPARSGEIRAALQASAEMSAPRHHGAHTVWAADGTSMLWDFTTAPMAHAGSGEVTFIVTARDVSDPSGQAQ